MPERVGLAPRRHQHVVADGIAEADVERLERDVAAGRQQVVADPAAGHGGGADDGLGLVAELVEAHQQQLGEVVGQRLRQPGRADQLLDEERVAVGALHDAGDLGLGRAASGGAGGRGCGRRRRAAG